MRATLRSSLAWLFLLLQVSLVAGTNAEYSFDERKDDSSQKKLGDDVANAGSELTDLPPPVQAVPQPGAEHVDEALRQLHTLGKPPHRRLRKESSIFGKAFSFVLRSIPLSPVSAPAQSDPESKRSPLQKPVQSLKKAAALNNSDALLMLGDFNFYGNFSHPRNLPLAFDYYHQLAQTHGNATGQYMVGLFHSTGLEDVVPQDQATALLYYSFAAMQGDAKSMMATAFRHNAGIGTPKNCEAATSYYKKVADKAIDWYRQGPPGNKAWIPQSYRLADNDGGIYGEGASVSSSGINAYRPSPNSDAHASVGDVLDYLEVLSNKGDAKAILELGKRYYDGQRGLERNLEQASKYFAQMTSKLWGSDGRIIEGHPVGIERSAARAAGYLGWMFLRGERFKQNYEAAYKWLDRGAKFGDAQSMHGLGLMLLNGWGAKINIKKATEYLKVAAEQDFAPAQVMMGRLYLDQGGPEDLRIANNWFELAARHGNMESHYYIAEMIHHGVGREHDCRMAMNYYKSVAEKAEPMLSAWEDANLAQDAGNSELAFLQYLVLAEQGYEKAQTNVAYLLDHSKSALPVTVGPKPDGLFNNPALALMYWTRSWKQANVDALVKMGDYYFHGIGTPADLGKAVQCYTGASDYSQSAQALFNLGWMHENGVGLTQDFHLAKRYYDHALEVNNEAYGPVTLSLLKLRARSAWNTLTGGSIHSIQDEKRVKKDWSFTEWIKNFLDETPGFDEEYYEDVYGDDTLDGDYEDDGILESLAIIGITGALVVLLWWRARIQQRQAQQVDDARRRAQGLEPRPLPQGQAPGAEGFAGWAAGNGFGL